MKEFKVLTVAGSVHLVKDVSSIQVQDQGVLVFMDDQFNWIACFALVNIKGVVAVDKLVD